MRPCLHFKPENLAAYSLRTLNLIRQIPKLPYWPLSGSCTNLMAPVCTKYAFAGPTAGLSADFRLAPSRTLAAPAKELAQIHCLYGGFLTRAEDDPLVNSQTSDMTHLSAELGGT